MRKILSITALAALILMSGIGIAQAQWGGGSNGRQSGGWTNGSSYGQSGYTTGLGASNSGRYGNNQSGGRNMGYTGSQGSGWTNGGNQGGSWNRGNQGGGGSRGWR